MSGYVKTEHSLFGKWAGKDLKDNIALSLQEDFALNLLLGKTYTTTHEGYIPSQARQGTLRFRSSNNRTHYTNCYSF
jgi:hypothetical protein